MGDWASSRGDAWGALKQFSWLVSLSGQYLCDDAMMNGEVSSNAVQVLSSNPATATAWSTPLMVVTTRMQFPRALRSSMNGFIP